MKTQTLNQLELIAQKYGAIFHEDGSDNQLPTIEWEDGDYGFEATEQPEEGCFNGFTYFGPAEFQAYDQVRKCWNELTLPAIDGELLTIELAHQLMGKKIQVRYHDNNQGIERFRIVGMHKQPEKMIGQSTAYRLHTIPLDQDFNEKKLIGSREFYLNGKRIYPDTRDYVIEGKPVNVMSAGTKRDLTDTALLKYLQKHNILTTDGRTITEIKCYKCDINTGWWNVSWFKLSDGEVIRKGDDIYIGSQVHRIFNVTPLQYLREGDTSCEGVLIKTSEYEEYIYEWEGIFRIGSGAERLIIDKVIE